LVVFSLGYDDCARRQRVEAIALATALDPVVSWRPTARGLDLLSVGGATRLSLAAESVEGPAGAWVVERYRRPNGRPVDVLDGAPPSLTLEPGGAVVGSTGCRFFEGSWTSDADGIAIGPIETVGLPCEGDLRRQERQLLRAVGESIRWERQGDALRLIDAFGMPAVELRESRLDGDGE
jgi:heat shock protein HslJ